MSDESVRHIVREHAWRSPGADDGARHSVDLDPGEALRLLGSVPVGRIVFTRGALPAVRPVNHILDDGDIVIRTHEDAALVARARQAGGGVVAFEADDIDPVRHLGWSVVATGYCRLVTDAAQIARYSALLQPWSDQQMDHVVRIRPELITGIRLVPAEYPG